MEPIRKDHEGRFAQAAKDARSKTPKGISKKEGWIVVFQAIGGALFLSFMFQSHRLEWGGIIRFLVQIIFLATILLVAARLTHVRGVHPVGHKRRIFLAGALPVLTAAIGGYFWTVPLTHETPVATTTAVAFLSFVPFALLGISLIMRSEE